MPALRRTTSALVGAALAGTFAIAVAQPASAAPPTAVDDHVRLYAGQARTVDVLANDSDPDGDDDLTICRIAGPSEGDNYFVHIDGGSLFVATSPWATEDITITYYACDYETLVPATLTISLKEVQPVTVRKLDRPGRIRVTNSNDRKVRFLWGSFREKRPDGRVRVPANDSVVVAVHRRKVDWVAVLGTAPAGQGHVRHIDLPKADRRAAVPSLGRADARAWTRAR